MGARAGARRSRRRPTSSCRCPIPACRRRSATPSASGIPFELGIIRNHYVGRTFIQPTQTIRELGVRMKHSANRAVVDGKRIVLIDDSIVRGTTSVKIVQMMRDAGAKRSAFPHRLAADHPSRLLRHRHAASGTSCSPPPTISKSMRQFIGADSLAFLSVDGIYRAMGEKSRDPARPQFTDHCFTGEYPTPLTDLNGKDAPHSNCRCSPKRADRSRPPMPTIHAREKTRGPHRARHRRLARHRPCRRAGAGARAAPMSSPWRAPRARSKSSTTKSARSAARPRSFLATSRDFPALDRLGAAIFERWGKLDIFVGNAGLLGPLTPFAHCDPKKWDKLFAVNVTANYRLLRSLDPLLRASDAGRVVLISSGAAQRADYRAFWGPYATSKAARGRDAAHLCGRHRQCLEHQGDERQSRPDAHENARLGDAGRRPDDPAHARGIRAPKLADLCGPDWTQTGRIYDFPTDTVLSVPGTGLTAVRPFAPHKRARSVGEKAGLPAGKRCPAGCDA